MLEICRYLVQTAADDGIYGSVSNGSPSAGLPKAILVLEAVSTARAPPMRQFRSVE